MSKKSKLVIVVVALLASLASASWMLSSSAAKAPDPSLIKNASLTPEELAALQADQKKEKPATNQVPFSRAAAKPK